ncbi:MAG: hypothetical protein J1F31_06060 [Erysipelotrichales bacterium]|nr:hypothetical protein [Erysipelotrichales bacterium]
MKNLKYVEKKLFGSEQIICSAKQFPRIVFWLIKHLIIYFVVIGLPFGTFMIISALIPTLQEFLMKNAYIYFIYAGIAGIWWFILLIRFLIKLIKLAPYQVFLTTKRVIILHRGNLTTVLFDSITGVTMNTKVDVESEKAVYIEIKTASETYSLRGMKNGNKLMSMLSNILLGGTIKITQLEENGATNNKAKDNMESGEQTKEAETIKIKPDVKVDKIPKTQISATDILLQKTNSMIGTDTQADSKQDKKGD